MSKWQTKIGFAVLATVLMASPAYAITFVKTFQGTVNLTNYTGFYQDDLSTYTGPATVLIQEINMKPGDAFPWHYHEGQSYAILTKGTLTEEDSSCSTTNVSPGTGFVEPPGFVHRVMDKGPGDVTIYWATVYPNESQDPRISGPLVTQRSDGSSVAPDDCH